ncbi:Arc/MetJ-type ribon-helix-helix transcriptional regulator [Bradyrhizobium sp. GM24.11]
MAKSNKVVPKKGRGRPATGRDPVTAIRLSPELRATVDAWGEKQGDNPGRSEAIRRLVELGLTVRSKGRPGSELPTDRKATSRQRAGEMASKAIDEMSDATANPDDQAIRKRRLVKGPEEFQKARRDRNRK